MAPEKRQQRPKIANLPKIRAGQATSTHRPSAHLHASGFSGSSIFDRADDRRENGSAGNR